jgi:chromosome segregation ATPase
MIAVPSALAVARAADSARRHDRVRQALVAMVDTGQEMTISSVARAARVHRSFIHRHPELHAAIQDAQQRPHGPSTPTVSTASLHTDLANLHAQNRRLLQQVRQLERRLSEALGNKAYEASGIGAPDKTAILEHRCVELEQRLLDLTGQLDERTDELQAARNANRALMTTINRTQPPPPTSHRRR